MKAFVFRDARRMKIRSSSNCFRIVVASDLSWCSAEASPAKCS